MPKQQPVEITGVHLVKIGPHVIVNIEVDGKWFEIIREHEDGSFSHILRSKRYAHTSEARAAFFRRDAASWATVKESR